MGNNNLNLKSISEILDYNFFIPSYQRGYRWGEQQVLDLLNDINEFAENRDNDKGFYCLQPLVVKFDNNNSQYIVIDGQQRLTTIYIILKYLEEARKIIFSDEKLFTISYETREVKENSKSFLKNINFLRNIDYSNPDFYYMSKAYFTIKNWFEENKINKGNILNILLRFKIDEDTKKDIENNIRFIWYELAENEDEIEVFTRLNIGKIPLSNSELIKAIILSKLRDYEQTEIVSEWDYIEKNLQNDRFFSFLTQKSYKKTRIDFIFNLLAKKYKKEYNLNYKNDDRFSFYVFNHLIKDSLKNKKNLWNEVKEYFRIFEELYNDNIYYHYVGFITNNPNSKIEEILEIYKNSNKNKFKTELEKLMQIKIDDKLQNLSYETDKNELEKLLFLFNVLITMESGYSRYPFDIHNKEKWSLEHIHAQNSEEISNKDKKQLLVLQFNSPYIDNKIKIKIKNLIDSTTIDDKEFIKIQEKIYKQFTDEEKEIHSIDNLALLSKNDNSSLSNSIFPEKRSKIKQLDEKGKFIPLGTKNVFMKYYSDKVDEFLTWNREDRNSYLKVLTNKLALFIKDK